MAHEQKKTEESKQLTVPEREELTLKRWHDQNIFEKTLEATRNCPPFVFYDGPPFATGLPHYGHILAGTIKDAIPRYRTMRGRFVRRVWGWDCHGLPIEHIVEQELGFNSKRDIEEHGIEAFNEAARKSVLRYDADWRRIVPRMGRFVDMEHSYKTMDWKYTESVWWVFKRLYDKGLIYKGYKPMHVCPRCETTLSNNEVAGEYENIKDISVTVRFSLEDEPGVSALAWTTTPWTLPGNVALAVGATIEYVYAEVETADGTVETIIVARERLDEVCERAGATVRRVLRTVKGTELAGKRYRPLFEYYAHNESLEHRENGWRIYTADFVTTEEGTGIVHIAPAFGEDDMSLGRRYHLPFVQHVSMDGTFKREVADFAGMRVKTREDNTSADIAIVKWLARHGKLWSKQKIEHSYPHCWRCKTPLLNYAAESWFLKVTALRDRMLEENRSVRWVPERIGAARFANWLSSARDWAISRSRYWGAPFPVWVCDTCGASEVIGSLKEITERVPARNRYLIVRHGEAQNNVEGRVSSDVSRPDHLTERGRKQAKSAADTLARSCKEDECVVVASDFVRTRETAEIIAERLGVSVVYDKRLRETRTGIYDGRPAREYWDFAGGVRGKFETAPEGGETLNELKGRVTEALYDLEDRYQGKTIILVTHEWPAWLLTAGAAGMDADAAVALKEKHAGEFIKNAEVRELPFTPLPHNRYGELDLHRPYIDRLVWVCRCGGAMRRIPDVFDCWFESGSMPYGQIHYPFENVELFKSNFPADFIAEGLDQTRGWFYTLLVLAVGLFDRAPYRTVIVNGIILGEDGQKMSKSLRNYPDPMDIVGKYGADALRYYLLASPAVHGESLVFAEKEVGEVYRKVLIRLENVLAFFMTYRHIIKPYSGTRDEDDGHILDQWILARTKELVRDVSEGFESYWLDRATRPVGEFVDDLSTWYVRRSRTRFKRGGSGARRAAHTLGRVLEILSRVMAPITPFFAERLYLEVTEEMKRESVHLEEWPDASRLNAEDELLLNEMKKVREIVSQTLLMRAQAGIKVRQPLACLRVGADMTKDIRPSMYEAYADIIRDEVNVKEVAMGVRDTGLDLDTRVTPELRREGDIRELIRHIQQLRKKRGLTPNDTARLLMYTNEAGRDVVAAGRDEIMRTALLDDIVYADKISNGEKVTVRDMPFIISFA